jgi:two-component system phosphate regulon response regulator OmpR
MQQRQTLLIVAADRQRAWDLGEQLDADGHTIYLAHDRRGAIAKLSTHAIDVVILAGLERPADAPSLLRDLRAGQLHNRVHPAQPVVTIGAPDDLSVLRAYEAGSDHHIDIASGYLVLRAVLSALTHRTLHQTTSRHVHVGQLHIDTAARTATVNSAPVKLSRTEFDLLTKLASDPPRVFTKTDLKRAIWGTDAPHRDRTLDSHIHRLRRRLNDAGAQLIHTSRGLGYSLHATP